MKNVSFALIDNSFQQHNSNDSQNSRKKSSGYPNLNHSDIIAIQNNGPSESFYSFSKSTGQVRTKKSNLIARMAKIAAQEKMTVATRDDPGNRRENKSTKDLYLQNNPAEYGSSKSYLQLNGLRREPNHPIKPKNRLTSNQSFDIQQGEDQIAENNLTMQRINENSLIDEGQTQNRNHTRFQSLPPLENRSQKNTNNQSNILADLRLQPNERVLYNPRSKNPYKIIKAEEIKPEDDSIIFEKPTTQQMVKYTKNSISPLLEIKKTFQDPKQNRENRLRVYLHNIETEKERNTVKLAKNKDKLYDNLSLLKPRLTFIPNPNHIDREVLDGKKQPLPNSSVLDHLTYLEKKTVEEVGNTLVRNQKPFEYGITNKYDMAVAKIQGRVERVEQNDLIYGPSLMDLGRQGIVTKEESAIKEVTAFWRKNIGKIDQTRWDLFEESIRIYIEETIPEAETYFKQFNFTDFFSYVKAKLSHYDSSSNAEENKIRETIESPLCKGEMDYPGPIVSLSTLLQFAKLYGLKYMFNHLFHEFFILLKKHGYQLQAITENQNLEWAGTSIHTEKYQGSYQYGCGSSYKGKWEYGKRHGKGKLLVMTGDTYEGDFANGRRHGYGIQILNRPIKGVKYKGEWKDDLRHGYGAAEWPDGTFFQGKWEDGLQIFGTFVWPFQGEYTGHWKGPEMEGEGTFKSKDGDIYKGHWKNSVLNGEGERITSQNEIYRGFWTNGQLNGKAYIKTVIGVYEGDVVNSIENGIGTMTWADKNKYIGEWKDGLPHGKGKFISNSAEIYEGDFVEGRKEGRGKKVFSNQDIYDGEWFDDCMTGEGNMIYGAYDAEKTGRNPKYAGFWRNNLREGFGVMWYEDESIYEGLWLNGKRHGDGKLILVLYDNRGQKQEMIYEGKFANDSINGFGVMVWPNGDTYKGEWVNGRRQGRGQMKIGNSDWIEGLFNNDQLIDASLNQIKQRNIEDVKKLNAVLNDNYYLQPVKQQEP